MARQQTEGDFGTFEKDGETRKATDNAQAVDLRFRGWTEKKAGKSTSAQSTTSS